MKNTLKDLWQTKIFKYEIVFLFIVTLICAFSFPAPSNSLEQGIISSVAETELQP